MKKETTNKINKLQTVMIAISTVALLALNYTFYLQSQDLKACENDYITLQKEYNLFISDATDYVEELQNRIFELMNKSLVPDEEVEEFDIENAVRSI